MIDWYWGIYGLAIICGISLFYQHSNNFYFYRYLVSYFNLSKVLIKIKKNLNKVKEKKFRKSIINKGKLIIIKMFLLVVLFVIVKIIFKNIHEVYTEINIEQLKDIVKKIIIIIIFTPVILIIAIYFFYRIDVVISFFFKKIGKFLKILKLLKENFTAITVLFLSVFFEISTISWFQRFNVALAVLVVEFCFVIYTLYCLKIVILFKLKNIYTKIILILIVYLILVFTLLFGFFYNEKVNIAGIRVTKGNFKNFEGGGIELLLEDNKMLFPIIKEDNKYYIINNTFLKHGEKVEILFKDNNAFLFINDEFLPRKGEFIFLNNRNSKVINSNGEKIDIDIAGKIVIIKNGDEYVFLNGNLGWDYLKKDEKIRIRIEEDNFVYNLINLFLFLFGIIYFWLKLYGKKNEEYFDYITIVEIKNTKILLDRNKYDKFLTLSMFGLTIPNIWKIATITNIGEMQKQINVWSFGWLFIFSIILFCIITSREISEYVKKLKNEKS